MAITSFPFDNEDTTETQFSDMFRELQDSGVADSANGTALQVTASGGFGISVAAGSAFLRGFMAINDAIDTSKTLSAPSSTARTDLVVLRMDPSANGTTLEILTGTPGSGEPSPTQTDTGVFELPLAAIPINPSDSAISTIQDRRRFTGGRVGAWTTALRPVGPRFARLGFNVTTGLWEFFTGTGWANLIPDTVLNATKWNGFSLTVSATTPSGTPTADRIWIQPIS